MGFSIAFISLNLLALAMYSSLFPVFKVFFVGVFVLFLLLNNTYCCASFKSTTVRFRSAKVANVIYALWFLWL